MWEIYLHIYPGPSHRLIAISMLVTISSPKDQLLFRSILIFPWIVCGIFGGEGEWKDKDKGKRKDTWGKSGGPRQCKIFTKSSSPLSSSRLDMSMLMFVRGRAFVIVSFGFIFRLVKQIFFCID